MITHDQHIISKGSIAPVRSGSTSLAKTMTAMETHLIQILKGKNECITNKHVTPCIPTENVLVGAEMPKEAEKTLQGESANQKESK